MWTPEQWAEAIDSAFDDPNIGVGSRIMRANIRQHVIDALAERDAEIARAREAEILARCERWDSEQHDDRDRWDAIKAAAVEEVRGQVLAIAENRFRGTTLTRDKWLIDRIKALGPSRPPLPPTALEAGVRELLAWAEEMRQHANAATASGTEPFASQAEGEDLVYHDVAARVRKILGEEER